MAEVSHWMPSAGTVWAQGQTVGAYIARSRQENDSPASSPVDTGLVQADGSLTFEGLTSSTEYVAYGVVGSLHRYVYFRTEDVDPGDVVDATATVKGVLKLTNDLGGTAALPTVPGLAAKYEKPVGGIPESDWTVEAQDRLDSVDAMLASGSYLGDYDDLTPTDPVNQGDTVLHGGVMWMRRATGVIPASWDPVEWSQIGNPIVDSILRPAASLSAMAGGTLISLGGITCSRLRGDQTNYEQIGFIFKPQPHWITASANVVWTHNSGVGATSPDQTSTPAGAPTLLLSTHTLDIAGGDTIDPTSFDNNGTNFSSDSVPTRKLRKVSEVATGIPIDPTMVTIVRLLRVSRTGTLDAISSYPIYVESIELVRET